MATPIGDLILIAEGRTKQVGSEHTAKADCGCQVTISRFSKGGARIKSEPCSEHALDPNRRM